jgi:hypothetical protein
VQPRMPHGLRGIKINVWGASEASSMRRRAGVVEEGAG